MMVDVEVEEKNKVGEEQKKLNFEVEVEGKVDI